MHVFNAETASSSRPVLNRAKPNPRYIEDLPKGLSRITFWNKGTASSHLRAWFWSDLFPDDATLSVVKRSRKHVGSGGCTRESVCPEEG